MLITAISVSLPAQDVPRLRTTTYHGMELPYEIIDGLAIHAGDMILGTADEAVSHSHGRVRKRSRNFLPVDDRVSHALPPCCPEILWPQGVIPYVIDNDVPRPEWILEAMSLWNEQTVVQFVERSTERDYLRFAVREPGCTGVFGRGFDGCERVMPISPGGCSVPITLHELGHSIGLGHEQQRKDRDQWVRVFRENIDPGDGAGQWHPPAAATCNRPGYHQSRMDVSHSPAE